MARARIADAEKEAWRVEQLLREAADVAQASNMARAECEQVQSSSAHICPSNKYGTCPANC